MFDYELYRDNYYSQMIPVEYPLKDGDMINIYPILVKDFLRYDWAKNVLTIEKNKTNDIEIISMNYLTFLNDIVFKQPDIGQEYMNKFVWIMKLCLHEEFVAIRDKKLIICDENQVVKHIITQNQFNDITKIILSYNDINYDDREVSEEVKELANEYYKIRYRNTVSPTIEKQKGFVSSKTGKTFMELNELPYREFQLIYDSCLQSELYLVDKIMQASEKFDIKENITHPLFTPKKDPYSELFTDKSVLQNKGLSGANMIGVGIDD